MRVEIWTDINCPFCYLGKARFEEALTEFAHRDDVEVVHRSFELDPTLPADESGPVIAKIARKYGISEAQAAANERGIGAQAAEYGLPYLTEGRDYGNSFDMHRLLHHALALGVQDALLDAFYRANFADERSLFGDHERLVEVAVGAGLDEAGVRVVLADPSAYADDVRADEQEAAQLGANGVPFFVIDRKYGVSGAQPAALFSKALDQAWADRVPAVQMVGDGDACGPDGCEVPVRG
ncbi:DsbA family oxidoreductase [Nocardia cyriacigeorgica]|uniref:DsbA family oxidoreductase n=1 Tax=Nocardia cyriacigeorgica TaxID=135487 RepID=A0A6P1DF02_9NOCA|nr:DsbA family oxidoreductase [Nocardia cyriacigeorgica]NEW47330.1 DsbA family oxidoreductase [Nocardia cyriacigeorgica]NEW51198.1 DsbA family oxidoreductase [Nocardia cyriacigeorgica]